MEELFQALREALLTDWGILAVIVADKDFDNAIFAGASCAFGVFDGVHRGHQYLIDHTIATANEGRSIIITFDRDPDEIFHPARLHKLMTNEERIAALEATGVDDIVVLPFTSDLYTMAPDVFLDSLFSKGLPTHLHIGEDFRFGAKAQGTVQSLQTWAAENATEECMLKVHGHPLLNAEGSPITATRIRVLIEQGENDEAVELLGHVLE